MYFFRDFIVKLIIVKFIDTYKLGKNTKLKDLCHSSIVFEIHDYV